jgi:Scaffold protein Nfu/NifU N terminal
MSEYIEIITEELDDPDSLNIYTNLRLTEGEIETYSSRREMELGSAVAQALSAADGLAEVTLEGDTIFVRREAGYDWHGIVDDISALLKDFFL